MRDDGCASSVQNDHAGGITQDGRSRVYTHFRLDVSTETVDVCDRHAYRTGRRRRTFAIVCVLLAFEMNTVRWAITPEECIDIVETEAAGILEKPLGIGQNIRGDVGG